MKGGKRKGAAAVAAGAAVVVAVLAGAALWQQARPTVAYQTEAVARTDVEATVTAIGTLQPLSYVDVGAQVSGQIVRLAVAPGDPVAKGDLLVEIDPSVQRAAVDAGRASLAGLRAQLAEQQAQARLAGQQLARQQALILHRATPEEAVQTAQANHAVALARMAHLKAQIDQTQATLQADEARLGYTRIYAPMTGTVVAVEARAGQTLNAAYQTPNVLRIADLSAMTVWTEVSEADVRRVRPGMAVYFTTLGGAGQARPRRWHSTVRQVLPAPAASPAGAVPATKTVVYTVLFDVDNADEELMPQMTAQVVFVTDRAAQALAVPLAAVQEDGSAGPQVRVLDARGQARPRRVALGVRSRHQVQVLDGLAEGERVVVGETAQAGGLRWLQW